MATIEIPKVRKESTVIMYVSLTDNGVTVDWTSLSEIKPFMYSDEQHCIAGKCTAEIATGAPETLIVRYPTTAPQFLGQNSLLIRCTYDGNEKSFDVPVLEFVDRSSEATGVTVIEDPELPVAIEVQDVNTSVLDDAIAAALDAAAKATAAAELVPLDILAQCQAAAEAAEAAAENCAPVIGDNGNWWIYDYDAGEYVDSGKPSRGIQGEQGIQGIQGIQGNTGSSVDYPYELVNNLTTDDATKGLSAAQGVALKSEVSQLDQKVDVIDGEFDKEPVVCSNLLDWSKVENGYYWTDGFHESSSYYCTDHIPVEPSKTYTLQATVSNARAVRSCRFVVFCNSEKSIISAGAGTNVENITAPAGASYMLVSFRTDYGSSTKPDIVEGTEVVAHVPYFPPYDEVTLKTEAIKDKSLGQEKLQPQTKPFNRLWVSGSVADAIYLDKPVSVIKNACITAVIDGAIQTAGVAVGVGYNANNTSHREGYAHWLVVKPSVVEVYRNTGSGDTLLYTYEHGITLTNKTFVYIRKKEGNNILAELRIGNDLGAAFSQDIAAWYGNGVPFVQNLGNSAINAEVSMQPLDLSKKVWLFGDSYCGFWNDDRWPYYLMAAGYTNYLLNNHAGAAASVGLTELQTLLATGAKPSYLVWTFGMNGVADAYDSESGTYVINPAQKVVLDEMLAICNAFGIIPILATIPSVPSIRHTGYNTYIKSLEVRYIDFDAAVGAQADGTWNTGLLSTDNVHPTALGAKVLYGQAIADCPELLVNDL